MKKTGGAGVAKAVRELALPIAERLGFKLWDVEYQTEGGMRILRILLDKEGGVSLDDCAAFSREFDPVLDKADPVETQYFLEVSSAGLTRQLKSKEHFKACIGMRVEAKLYGARDGKKIIEGTLVSYEDGLITISEAGGEKLELSEPEVAGVWLAVDF